MPDIINKNLRIVFMGTPDFAVASLKALVESGKNIVAVITAPDKPAGRGMQLTPSPVKRYALEQGLKILQPEKLKDERFVNELQTLQPELGIVVAFRMLPEVVWKMPRMGTFNLHASLLPQYRGAAPIHWTVINGEKETGVTTFFLKHEIDTGEIILQEKTNIGDEETTGELYNRLMHIGAKLVVKTVDLLESGSVITIPQQPSDAVKNAPKIFKEMCRINWNQSGKSIFNFVRGLHPVPGAYTIADGKIFKLHKVSFEPATHHHALKHIIKHQQSMKVAVQDGFIHIHELQAEGKKRMTAAEFLMGNIIKQID
jgi:methionyl-tRNA formyltransferase